MTATGEGRPLPLAGVRIVDFSWIVAGPQATRILADLGADVIRVENESYLDSVRMSTPEKGSEGNINRGGLFHDLNRNKRGITANLHHPEGRAVVERLIAGADAVVENYSAGAFERMGFGWERLQELNPRIIYYSASGFGHQGRDASYVTWGPTAQAISGLTYLSGRPDLPPAGWGFSYLDHSAGYYGAIGLLMALRRKARGAGAQRVDLSQAETGMTMCGVEMLDWQINGRASERIGNRSRQPGIAPHGVYRCQGDDRWIAIAVESDAQWQALCEVLHAPELAGDPRFATAEGRTAAQDDLDAALDARTREHEEHVLTYALQARGVPAGAAQTTQDKMERDPQLAARGFYPTAPIPGGDEHRFEGVPFQFRRLRWRIDRGGPALGEDTEAVLAEIGIAGDELARLRAEAAL